jgi:hypothetical protein
MIFSKETKMDEEARHITQSDLREDREFFEENRFHSWLSHSAALSFIDELLYYDEHLPENEKTLPHRIIFTHFMRPGPGDSEYKISVVLTKAMNSDGAFVIGSLEPRQAGIDRVVNYHTCGYEEFKSRVMKAGDPEKAFNAYLGELRALSKKPRIMYPVLSHLAPS